MDSINKAAELLAKRIFGISGVNGMGVVDYDGNGKKQIEISVQTETARESVKKIIEEDYFKNYPYSIISPGETKLL